MNEINKTYKQQIKELVTEIETKTECEIVPMIIKSSNRYIQANFLSAIIFSILLSIGLYLSPLNFINPVYYIWIQIIGLVIGFMLGEFPLIKRIFIAKRDIKYEVDLRASEAFLHYNLHLTEKHNGVLVFISLFERKIKIICDKTVKDQIDQKIWNEIIDEFIDESKHHTIKEALVVTLTHIGSLLENKFPNKDANQKNELSDELILEI
jgi:putative membrane protein